MIYEYAIEPALVVNWALGGIARSIGQFGLDSRRLVSDFPRDWKGKVYAEFLARFNFDYSDPAVTNTSPTLDAYLQILTDRMVERGITFPEDAVWLKEAIREHAARPFHAILVTAPGADAPQGVITERNMDDLRDPYWWLPTIRTTRKSAAEIGLALRPILQAATDIHIVDPYFDAAEKRFRDAFAAIAGQTVLAPRAVSSKPTITLVTGVERLFKERERPSNEDERTKRLGAEAKAAAHIRDMVMQHLRPLAPPGLGVRLIVLRSTPGGDPLHNRFVLTNVGGVILPYGVDDYDREPKHAAQDDLVPMLRGMYEERWKQYVRLTTGQKVLGPEDIVGG